MTIVLFILISALTSLAIGASVVLGRLLHSLLAVGASFALMALLAFVLNSPFICFAQLLTFLGITAVMLLFSFLHDEAPADSFFQHTPEKPLLQWGGVLTSASTFALLAYALIASPTLKGFTTLTSTESSVAHMGRVLTQHHLLSLELLALLLGAVLVGTTILTLIERHPRA